MSSPAGSRSHGRSTPRAAGLAGWLFSAVLAFGAGAGGGLAAEGCAHGEGPRVVIVNRSGQRADGLWVHTEHDSVRVPTLAPGESREVRPPVHGEDLLWISGRFAGRPLDSNGGEYVEGTGGYRFRAVIDSSGHAELKFVRLGIW